MWRWVVLWSLWASRAVRHSSPLVRVQGGLVRGVLSPDGTHYQYTGIPYATSQHKYRFQAPGPAPEWQGVLDVTEQHVRCAQLWAAGLVVGREECLVLNVYSPVGARPEAPLPVMVFIHGGGFKEGSGTRLLYGPDYLVARGVILVTFNYRLGVHGFLCLGIKEAPGNAGMKDQVAALHWVQRNIRAFGGDPDNVTLFGESAGAASVSYHLLSPLSRGLFHRAILQSGSATASWATQRQPLRVATQLARALGHHVEEPRELYNIFMNETLSDLITANIPPVEGRLKFMHLPYVPCVERHIVGVRPFITEAPMDILSRGDHYKVPVIIGSNNEEGYFFAAFEDDYSLSNIKFEQILPTDLHFSSEAERLEAGRQLREMYMGDEEVSPENILRLSKLHGDLYFTYPALTETEWLLRPGGAPVHSYLFEHDGWRNFPKLISGLTYWLSGGATHADELFYLFSLFPTPSLYESHMIDTMTLLWTNFAKYGEPGAAGGVRWQAAGGAAPSTLRLSARPRPAPLGEHRARHMHFWRALYAPGTLAGAH